MGQSLKIKSLPVHLGELTYRMFSRKVSQLDKNLPLVLGNLTLLSASAINHILP